MSNATTINIASESSTLNIFTAFIEQKGYDYGKDNFFWTNTDIFMGKIVTLHHYRIQIQTFL